MSLFVAWGLGLMGFSRMGALRSASSGETVVTGPGAGTGEPLGLLLTLTQA